MVLMMGRGIINREYRSHLSYILFDDVNKYRINMDAPILEILETAL